MKKNNHLTKSGQFVVVNGSVLDFAKYRENVVLLAGILAADLDSYGCTLGFSCRVKRKRRYDSYRFVYCHRQLDLELDVRLRRKSGDLFV